MKFKRSTEVELDPKDIAEPFAEEFFDRLVDLVEENDNCLIGDYLENEYDIQLVNTSPSELNEFIKEVKMEIYDQITDKLCRKLGLASSR